MCACAISLSAIDGFVGSYVHVLSVCLLYMALSVLVCVYCQSACCRWVYRYVCVCTVSLSAIDGFVGMCMRVLSVCLL